MRRTRKPTSTGPGQAAASGLRAPASVPLPATPTSPAELLDRVGELRGLVAELADLTDAGGAWGMRVLRRNIELALLSPETLSSAQNQLDFIEELTGAVWDGSDARFRYAALPAATAEETCRRDARRLAIVERLDEIAHRLCAAAEAWGDAVAAAGEDVTAALQESPG